MPKTARPLALALSLALAAMASAEVVREDSFAGAQWSAAGPGPGQVADTPWVVRAFDSHDDKMIHESGEKAGGLHLVRGVAWGLPGAIVSYVGERAGDVRTIASTVELTAGQGDNGGRQTWLAGFCSPSDPASPALVLSLDTAGTNGTATNGGGPGAWSGATQTAGLKLYGSRGILPAAMVSGRGPDCYPPDYILLSPDAPQVGHTFSSLLSYHPATGDAACRVLDLSSDTTLYEGRFRLNPCAEALAPVLGGFNGFAPWASDKGFEMRIQSVRLEDACRFVGPVRPNPGVQEEDPMAHVPARPRAPALSDFCGATNIPGSDMWNELGVGWGRHDFSWGAIEPAQDQWRFSEYDQMVLQAHRYGLEILPMLGYSAPWAVAEGASGFAPPRNVADWEDFVETCVARYSRPPFNLRYFQVWNEPTLKAGFWKGETDDEFFERVYLPAARIIRRYGCKVVFSGWPCSDGVDALAALLDKYEAWRVTDTLDIHYYTLADMLKLYDRYVRTGKCEGIWQTEVGYHPFEGYLPNLYCRLLWFGLKEGWTDPNRFKLFWYAFWGAGPDADKCLTCPGNEGAVPSETHGARMLALKQVLGDGQLSAFGDFETTPAVDFSTDEAIPSVEGFRCGDRVVIAFQLDPAMERLAIGARLARPPASVARVDSVGRRRELQCAYADGLATVEVPLDDLQPLLARNWGNEVRYRIGYVVME